MRLPLVLLLMTLMGWNIHSYSQEFEVRSFEADPTDLAARRFPRTTVNDEPAALIKVMTNIEGMIFDSNIGIVDVERRDAEYWVYVAPRERRIRLMAPEFLAKDVSLPEPAQSHTVYQLVVTRKGMLAPITDLVRLTFRLNENDVFIRRGDQASVSTVGNMAVFNLEKGEHSFRFIKEGFDEKTLTLDVGDDDEVFVELTPGQVTTPFEPPGIILVNAEQPGTEVYLNEQRVGVTPYQNTHISGEYSLLLRHSDYHDHYQTFSLEAGATMAIPTVNLLPRYGFYEVTSTPSGAEVLLNNSLIGRTPLPKTQISSEYHELTVRYSMYHDHTETFTIEDGDHKRFDVELKPAFGGLRLTSEPSGALVFIAGREVGTTPYENMQKPSGRYNVRLSRDLYGDATETIVISDGETTERFIPLAQNFGTLNITAEQSDIYIDGERVGRGSHTEDLTPGRYLLKATRAQHHDDEREVFIRLGQTERIALSPAPKTGYVSITSEPFEAAGAEIWIDGVRQQQVTPAVIPLLEGSYKVRLKKSGFADAVEQVDVMERETTQKTIRLYAGMEVTITSEPSGAELFINGERVGTTPYINELSFGSHQLRLVNRSRTIEESIEIRQGGKSNFAFDVSIFRCGTDKLVDERDGNVYETVQIGSQCWMKENLKWLPSVSPPSNGSKTLPHYYVYGYQGNRVSEAAGTVNYRTYGALYNWPAAINACPPGWRLPSDQDWDILTDYLGGEPVAGGKMKAIGTSHWNSPNTDATNESGFLALPGGDRHINGSFYFIGSNGSWWSSAEHTSWNAFGRGMYHSAGSMDRVTTNKANGFSLRCVRNNARTEDE